MMVCKHCYSNKNIGQHDHAHQYSPCLGQCVGGNYWVAIFEMSIADFCPFLDLERVLSANHGADWPEDDSVGLGLGLGHGQALTVKGPILSIIRWA